MSQIPTKLRRGTNAYFHYCVGCECLHPLPDSWTFDGNIASPTFSPSFLHSWGDDRVCHYFITAGHVHYCGDCTHSLAGQTVPIAELPLDYQDFESPC